MLTHNNFQEVYDHSAGGVIGLDMAGTIVYANPKAIELLFAKKTHLGQPVNKFFKSIAQTDNNLQKLLSPNLVDGEFQLSIPNGPVKSVLISSTIYTDAAGENRIYLFIRNISALKKNENLLTYLNSAAEELAMARDTKSALNKISRLIVPKFASWFSIDVFIGGRLEELVLAHEDPDMIQWARKYREAYPVDLNSDQGTAHVVKTGIPSFVPVITEEMILASIIDPAQLEAVQRINLQSVITVAMFNKEAITGVISFISSTPGYFYDEVDLRFAQNFANLIGLAIENARLNEAAASDIEQRKKIEYELRKSEELFRFLADAIPHKMWTSVPNGEATYYNQGWYNYTGISSFEALKEKIWGILHPDDRQNTADLWSEAIKRGDGTTIEHRFRRYDGQYRWHLSRFSPHKDDDDNVLIWVGTSTDIHEQKAIQKELETSEAHFKALTQFNSLPIWQVNAQCETVFVNNAWRVFTGITSDNIAETNWTDNIHPDDREETVRQFNESFEQREPAHLKYRFNHAPTGEYRWVLDNAHPVFNPFFYGYIGTMTDIHEQEQARLTIQQLMGKKDEFISIASHELKTPLTSIKAFNQLMQRTTDPYRHETFVYKSADHIARLEKLINDLLDVTKINAGKMQYNFEPFVFSEMLTDSIEAAQHTAPNCQLILECADDIIYTGDRFRLEQVINNFLTNAIKYSPEGKQIIIKSKIQEDNIIVSVQDFGIGIAQDNLDKLFDRYYRVDNTAMRFEGLGLGLFISSEILKRHQGSFWIESELGKGSTFYFQLPLAEKTESVQTKSATFYRDNKITITYLKAQKRMEVDWTGFQNKATVQKGCMLMLDYLLNNKCDRIVNDNTRVEGNWSDAVDWVGNEWFPMMEKAGLKYFAHIFSPSTFSQLSAQKSIDIMAGIIITQYFTEIDPARAWIDSCPR